MIEFDLLKEIILYVEQVSEGKIVSYSLTTNASLLTPEIAEYLFSKNAMLLISLDGPKVIHDTNRRFSSNGEGSFDIIIHNMEEAIKKVPEYNKDIRINMVVNPEYDMSIMSSLFKKYEFINFENSAASIVDDYYSDEKNYYSNEFISSDRYEFFKTMLDVLGEHNISNIIPLHKINILKIKDKVRLLGSINNLPKYLNRSGPCVPGRDRLFINVDGDFFPCERVSEKSKAMKIGNLQSGFDMNNIYKMFSMSSNALCKNCWAINNCNLCVKYADNDTEISSSKLSSFCENTRGLALETIRVMTMFKEKEIGVL